eukprot:1160340-Pelagomonas_calceolata.AAC.4
MRTNSATAQPLMQNLAPLHTCSWMAADAGSCAASCVSCSQFWAARARPASNKPCSVQPASSCKYLLRSRCRSSVTSTQPARTAPLATVYPGQLHIEDQRAQRS